MNSLRRLLTALGDIRTEGPRAGNDMRIQNNSLAFLYAGHDINNHDIQPHCGRLDTQLATTSALGGDGESSATTAGGSHAFKIKASSSSAQ